MASRTFTYNFRGDFKNLAAGLAAMGKGVNDLGVKMTALDANGVKMRRGLTSIGDTAGKVGLVAAAGFAVVIGVAAKFEQAMSKVQAATHETAGNMEVLREAAIKAGADTVFSATEAADAITAMAKAGVSSADILGGGLNGALALASAGELEIAQAADIAATAMNQFGLAGKDIPHIADLLAGAASAAQGDVTDMAQALKYVGPVAHQMGISIEETSGVIAELASQGILADQAGTSMRGMLTSLTSPSHLAKEEMDALGISLYDASGQFVGFEGIAEQLHSTMGNLTNAERDQALGRIFGNEQITAARILYAGGADAVNQWTGEVIKQGDATGIAATKLDNLAGDLEQFKGSLETALIGAGTGSQGPLRSIVQGATDVVNAFNKLPQSGQNAATGLLAVTAVLGGGLWFTAKTITGISNAKNALSDLGIEAGRTRGALANIGTAAVGIAAVVATLDVLQAGFDKLANTKLDTANLSRDLEALADGRITENLDNLFHTFQDIDNGWQAKANPLSWISSWDPSGFEAAEKNITAIDAALAGLVESGNADTAAEAFANLGPTAEKAGLGVEELKDLFPEYATALDNAGSAAEGAAGSNEELAGATGKAATAADRAAARMQRMAAALEKQQKAARDTAKSFITLGDSLDNPKKSLGEWLRELEKQAAALRDFTKNAQTAAKRGLDDGLIKSLNEAGPAGALRMKQLANATDGEIKRANKAWRQGQAAIREYVDMQVPDKPINVDTSRAKRNLNILYAQLAELNGKHVTTYIDVVRNSFDSKREGIPRASGGPIVGRGTKTSDSVPVMASNGEFMMSAAAVDHYGLGTMFAMNARRLAGGGSVNGAVASVGAGGTPFAPDSAFDVMSWLVGLNRLGKKELNHRANILDREESLAEKSLQQAKDRLDEERQQLQDLRDQRRQFMQDVTGNFRSDIFGTNADLTDAALNGQLGSSFQQGLQAYLQASGAQVGIGMSREDQAALIQQYLATLSASQIAALQGTANAQATIGTLQQDSQDAEAFEKLLRRLRRMGLTGGAFNELASSGNLAQAQAYLQMGPDFIKSLMQDFRQRNRDLRDLGKYVGNERFGADIREQLQETRRATRVAEEARDDLREIKQAQRDVVARLDRIEKNSPKKTGEATARALDHAAGASHRGP